VAPKLAPALTRRSTQSLDSAERAPEIAALARPEPGANRGNAEAIARLAPRRRIEIVVVSGSVCC
jgi:hypothetical protein